MSNDDKVGYGRPPKKSRFKPGQSGNPRGRPKGTKDLKTDLAEELQEQVLVTEGGRKKSISKQRAMLKSLMARAVQGDVRAAVAVISELHRLALANVGNDESESLSMDDQMLLDLYVAAHGAGGDPEQ
jgi:hypothetical protein